MKNNNLANIAVLLLVACALLQTGMIARREFFAPPSSPTTEPKKVKDWREYGSIGTLIGTGNKPVTIVEFSDFQCPFCARFASTLDSLRARYPDDVSIVYRHYPIPELHPHANTAAEAAECAGDQGRFKEYHDALFQQQDVIGKRTWNEFANDAGVSDLTVFEDCIKTQKHSERVKTDVADGKRLGVRGTPSVLINDKYYNGTIGLEELAGIVERLSRVAQRYP